MLNTELDKQSFPPRRIKIVGTHPGKTLKAEMKARNLSGLKLSQLLKVNRGRISTLINCKTSMTMDMAFRLGRLFNNEPMYWINLQTMYDFYNFDSTSGKKISKTIKPLK